MLYSHDQFDLSLIWSINLCILFYMEYYHNSIILLAPIIINKYLITKAGQINDIVLN